MQSDRRKIAASERLGATDSALASIKLAHTLKRPYRGLSSRAAQDWINSQREAKDRARELGAKIVAASSVDGAHELYDAATRRINQALSYASRIAIASSLNCCFMTIVSDEKQIINGSGGKTKYYSARRNPKQARSGQYEKAAGKMA